MTTLKRSGLLNLLWGLALAGLAAKILFSLNIVWQIFNFAFQVDESESMIVAETLLMSRGVDLYSPPTSDRFISAPYTPLFNLLNWPFLHLLGPTFKPGRLISFLAAVGIAALIYLFVRGWPSHNKLKGARLPAALAALAWCALGLVAFWGIAVKPDMTALFFSLSGLYLVYTLDRVPARLKTAGQNTRSGGILKYAIGPHGRLYGAAVLFALAALTKQTAFAGVLAALVWLVWQPGGWRRAVRLLALYLALGFVPMLLMNLFSRGGFWYHVVTIHELPWNFQNYWKFIGQFLQSYQLFVLLALAFVFFWLADLLRRPVSDAELWRRFRGHPGTFLLLYAGAAAGATLSAGTYGGNHNHLLEVAAAGCILLGATLARLDTAPVTPAPEQPASNGASWWSGRFRTARPTLGLALALGLISWQALGLFMGEARLKPENVPLAGQVEPLRTVLSGLRGQFFAPDWLGLEYRAPLEAQKKRLSEVAAFMNNDTGAYIYSDNVSLMLATNKPLFTTDPFTQTHATRYGRWDQRRLLEMVRRQEFSLVVLREAIERRVEKGQNASDIYLSPELAQAVSENYRLACRDIAFIYVPLSRQDFKGC